MCSCQKNRERVTIDNISYVIANPYDYKTSLEILSAAILETVSRIEKRQQDVLDLFDKGETFDKHKVVTKLRVSARTAASALKTLAQSGYLKENTNCKPYTYEKLTEKPKPFAFGDYAKEYEDFYEKQLKTWLDSVLPLTQPEVRFANTVKSNYTALANRTPPVVSCKVLSDTDSSFKEEKDVNPFAFLPNASETSQKQPNIVELDNGKVEYHYPSGHAETFYQCPTCKANNKQSFFSTVADLKAHISAFHETDSGYVR